MDVTPNLDRLAQAGTCFEHAFTCQPVCSPARICLQSGLYATQTGCFRNDIALPPRTKTIAHYLNNCGYHTAYIGKWHLASEDKYDYRIKNVPNNRRGGYKYWMAADILEFTSHGYGGYVYNTQGKKVEFDGYCADCLTDYALDYIKQSGNDMPFFLFLSYIEPHHQNDRDCYEGLVGSKEKFKDFVPPDDLADTEGDWRQNYPDYLGCCHSIDANIGRIVATLKDKGMWYYGVIC